MEPSCKKKKDDDSGEGNPYDKAKVALDDAANKKFHAWFSTT